MSKQLKIWIMKETEWKRKGEVIWNGISGFWFIIFINVFILESVGLVHLRLLSPNSYILLYFYPPFENFVFFFIWLDWPAILFVLLFFLPCPLEDSPLICRAGPRAWSMGAISKQQIFWQFGELSTIPVGLLSLGETSEDEARPSWY